MKNKIPCDNCNTENHHYLLNCENCGAYLRSKIPNTYFWETLWHIIEAPVSTMKQLVFAERKSFLIPLILFLGIKIFSISMFGTNLINPSSYDGNNLTLNFSIHLIALLSVIVFFSFLFKTVLGIFEVKTRFIDNFAVFVNSLLPLFIALVFLLPIEYAMFGKHWFIFNPSPFILKPNQAYILSGLEVLFQLWSMGLAITAAYAQSNSKLFAIISGVAFYLLILGTTLFLPFY